MGGGASRSKSKRRTAAPAPPPLQPQPQPQPQPPPPQPRPAPPPKPKELPEYCNTEEKHAALQVFTYTQLSAATNNFSKDRVLGGGAVGTVFKGMIENSKGHATIPVAIKKLTENDELAFEDLIKEVLLLGQLQHPHLVQLIGYCFEDSRALLVYEYVPNGSLDLHIARVFSPREDPLPWTTRLQIALDSAEALKYLHQQNVIHRDFKPPNILLDGNFRVKLADFGLAKLLNEDQTHASTRIMGTYGYIDPSYFITGSLTPKCDVYAFGILLLELLTGRRAIDERFEGEPLVGWVQTRLEEGSDVAALVDASIARHVETREARKTAKVLFITARHCIQSEPVDRPDMADVLEILRAKLSNTVGNG